MNMHIPAGKQLAFSRIRDKGISVEEARKQMLQAGEVPTGIASETRANKAVLGDAPLPAPVERKAVVHPLADAVGARFYVINEDGSEEEPIEVAESGAKLEGTIRRAHLQAQNQKKTIRVEILKEGGEVEEATPAPAAAPVAPATAPVVVEEDKTERIENNRFVCEISQKNGEWVAEIQYKNGAGMERFTAPTKNALTMKLLEGKGNATLRVREAIRREKYGVELDKVYKLPDYLTQAGFDALPEDARIAILDTVASEDGEKFKKSHPEYYGCEENSLKIQKFLDKRELPYTFRNLEYAFEELMDSEELILRPAPKNLAPSVSAPAALTGDSVVPAAPVVAAPAAAPAPAPAASVRKRGSTGLRPGHSSSANTELEPAPEESQKPKEPSVAELRQSSPIGLPPSAALKTAYRQSLTRRNI